MHQSRRLYFLLGKGTQDGYQKRARRDSWTPTNSVEALNLTHDLRIPLLSPRSRVQLETIRHQLMTDPVSRYIPNEGFLWPEMMSINLGSLSLRSEDAVLAATAHLKSLKLNELLREIREKGGKGKSLDLTKSTAGQVAGADEPIRISLNGIKQPYDIHNSHRLLTTALEADEVLHDFGEAIENSFFKAGWLKRIISPRVKIYSIVKLVESTRLRIPEKKDKPSMMKNLPEGQIIYKILKLNVEEILAKYHDYVWASDIALERLSIFKLGLYDFKRGAVLVGRGNHEVASVPLPGAPDIDLRAERKGLTYERTGKGGFFIPGATYDVTKR